MKGQSQPEAHGHHQKSTRSTEMLFQHSVELIIQSQGYPPLSHHYGLFLSYADSTAPVPSLESKRHVNNTPRNDSILPEGEDRCLNPVHNRVHFPFPSNERRSTLSS